MDLLTPKQLKTKVGIDDRFHKENTLKILKTFDNTKKKLEFFKIEMAKEKDKIIVDFDNTVQNIHKKRQKLFEEIQGLETKRDFMFQPLAAKENIINLKITEKKELIDAYKKLEKQVNDKICDNQIILNKIENESKFNRVKTKNLELKNEELNELQKENDIKKTQLIKFENRIKQNEKELYDKKLKLDRLKIDIDNIKKDIELKEINFKHQQKVKLQPFVKKEEEINLKLENSEKILNKIESLKKENKGKEEELKLFKQKLVEEDKYVKNNKTYLENSRKETLLFVEEEKSKSEELKKKTDLDNLILNQKKEKLQSDIVKLEEDNQKLKKEKDEKIRFLNEKEKQVNEKIEKNEQLLTDYNKLYQSVDEKIEKNQIILNDAERARSYCKMREKNIGIKENELSALDNILLEKEININNLEKQNLTLINNRNEGIEKRENEVKKRETVVNSDKDILRLKEIELRHIRAKLQDEREALNRAKQEIYGRS